MPKGRAAATACAVLLLAATVLAQTGKGKGRNNRANKPVSQPAAVGKEAAPSRPEPDTLPASAVAAPAMTGRGEAKTQAPASKTPGDAGVTVTSKGDGGIKQYRFTETDVEGRLQAPQLVYFLRRVRAEFAAGDLGHRSFMGELSDTARDPNF